MSPVYRRELYSLQGSGPILDMQAGMPIELRSQLRKQQKIIPDSIKIVAQVDTGASTTCIKAGLPAKLGLAPVGVQMIHTASTPNVLCDKYLIMFMIPSVNVCFEIAAIEMQLKNQPIDCLIARDVLCRYQARTLLGHWSP